MDTDESGKSSVPIETVKEVKASDVCKVCGNHGAVMYLGVKCCAPCKMFFRRNVDYDLVSEFSLTTAKVIFRCLCRIPMNVHSVKVVMWL